MKKIDLFGMVFLSLVLLGCMEQSRYSAELNEWVVGDSSIESTVSLGVIRSLSESITLPIGADVLLNATGALSLTNQQCSWNGNRWEGGENLLWNRDSLQATLVALYPYHPSYNYTAQELYTDGGLKDILYDAQQLEGQQDVTLSFKHLFSRISISASSAIQHKLSTLKLRTPCTILSLSPQTAELLYDTTQIQTVTLAPNDEGLYQFIVPPVNGLELSLSVEWNGALYNHTLGSTNFKSNHQYNYHLKSVSESIGIQTTDDFIAFSKLINGEYYAGDKSLSDFGSTENGVTTYHLLNDLEFAPEDSLKLSTIGRYSYFNDVFEGNNYTLSGLRLQHLSNLYGLFARVGSSGVIRNLHVSNSHIQGKNQSNLASFIAGYSEGIIDHCSVTNSVASIPTDSSGGLIVGRSTGTVLNCWSWNCRLDFQNSSSIGGVVGDNCGYIYNSFAGNLTFKARSYANYGGICVTLDANRVSGIENCYYFNTQSVAPAMGGILCSSPTECIGTIRYCFTNSALVVKVNSGKISLTTNYKFVDGFIYTKAGAPCRVVDGLNEWVVTTGAKLSKYRFKQWEIGVGGAPRLVQ